LILLFQQIRTVVKGNGVADDRGEDPVLGDFSSQFGMVDAQNRLFRLQKGQAVA
jgi:hypothetical protein